MCVYIYIYIYIYICMLTSHSVDEILLLMYMNRCTNFLCLPFGVERTPFCLKHTYSFIYVHVETNVSFLLQARGHTLCGILSVPCVFQCTNIFFRYMYCRWKYVVLVEYNQKMVLMCLLQDSNDYVEVGVSISWTKNFFSIFVKHYYSSNCFSVKTICKNYSFHLFPGYGIECFGEISEQECCTDIFCLDFFHNSTDCHNL